MRYNTLWRVPDALWVKLEPLLPPAKAAGTPGRPALAWCRVVNGILYVLRTGCQWKSPPEEWFGASSSLHDYFLAWQQRGVWQRLFQVLLRHYDKVKRIQWRWQALDSKSVAARWAARKRAEI
jgi:transposase